jgi:DhnA family fructose-bisphosphate aldolase class Ia
MDHKPFDLPGFFPAEVLQRITDIRVNAPEIVGHRAERRQRPNSWVKDSGNIVILAADHPARSVTKAAGDDFVMGNRHSYLGRLVRVLASPWCDGILGTPDILEDLLIVDHLIVESGGTSILDDRIMVGTMNRGGLAGTRFEMDDTFTAYTVDQIAESGLDAAKAMFRLDDTSPDSLKTLTACATAVDACVDRGIPMYLEALPVTRGDAGYSVVKTPEALMKVVGIASGIGKSSLNTWIKIPYCDDYASVAGATTCPILMLGGESSGDPSRIFHEFESGMAAGSNVRGALVGRNVHHPGTHDPAAIAAAVYQVVHSGLSADKASEVIASETAVNLDALTKVL